MGRSLVRTSSTVYAGCTCDFNNYDGTEKNNPLPASSNTECPNPVLAENHLFEFTTRLLEAESARGFTRSRLGSELIIAS